MHVPEAGNEVASGLHDFGAGGHSDFADWTDGRDAVARDENGVIWKERPIPDIDDGDAANCDRR